MSKIVRVLLADNHPVVRIGMRALLHKEDRVMIVGEATNGLQAQNMSLELKPDVLLLDLDLPGPPAVEIVSYVCNRCSEVSVLTLSAHNDRSNVQKLIAAGIAGYLMKHETPETIIQAISTVAQGGIWFSRHMVAALAPLKRNHLEAFPVDGLTEREQELLNMIARGWDNTRIAAHAHLAPQTVRNYVSQLYMKLNVQSRGEAIVWARERGLGAA